MCFRGSKRGWGGAQTSDVIGTRKSRPLYSSKKSRFAIFSEILEFQPARWLRCLVQKICVFQDQLMYWSRFRILLISLNCLGGSWIGSYDCWLMHHRRWFPIWMINRDIIFYIFLQQSTRKLFRQNYSAHSTLKLWKCTLFPDIFVWWS